MAEKQVLRGGDNQVSMGELRRHKAKLSSGSVPLNIAIAV